MPTRDSYEPGRPSWVDLGTSDPAAARSFYGELLGWSADVDPRPEAGGYAQFRRDGHAVAGVGPLFTEGMPPAWTMYIATDDADATAEAITANGGTLMVPPLDVLDAGRMAVFAGPDGAVAGLWQARRHTGAELVNEPGGWTWCHLATRDQPAAETFYAAVFGWAKRSDDQWGEYWALGEGEVASVSTIGDEMPAAVPAHWQLAFMVDDADATVARAVELGATPHGPMEDMPMGGRAGALADPQGAQFGVLSFAAPPDEPA